MLRAVGVGDADYVTDLWAAATFFSKGGAVKAFLLVTLAVTYFLALAFYPSVVRGTATHVYFRETYIGCIVVSMGLSAIALFARSGAGIVAIAVLRCYMLMLLGYGLGAYLSTKLVLGIGLMVEICVLSAPPGSLVLSGFIITVLALAQAFPVFFGSTSLVDTPARPRGDEFTVLCLVTAFAALLASWIDRLYAAQDDLAEALRIQENNIDTLAELNGKLQGYARTIDEESAERERNRISREIHDISGYIFTNLIALMDAAGSMPRDDHAALTDMILTARRQAQEGLQETRSALHRLRNEDARLVDSGQAIHKIVSIFRQVAGIDVDLNLGNLPRRLPGNLSLALYRTVQEALTNAVRHGRATRVGVNFWVEAGIVRLTIADDGKGAFEVIKGIGLAGMEERVGALGGSVGIGRTAEGGFALAIHVPLPTAPEAAGRMRP